MRYFKKIVGERIYLSPINPEDIVQYVEWLNNFEIAKYLGHVKRILSIPAEKEWLDNLGKNGNYTFAIVDKEHDKLLGNIGLMNIDSVDSHAEMGVFIGDEDYLSRGYGSEAIKLILDYGFNYLNLNNIMLKACAFNKRALKAYEKCGFKVFGVWKEAIYFNGKYEDEVFMNILKKDFNLQKLKRTND